MIRKLPRLEPDTAFFWTSGADGRLRIQRCADCGTWQHPPLPRCAECHGEAVGPEPVSGKGRIASYTVNHEAWLPGLAVPYILAMVELAEQAQLYVFTTLVATEAEARTGLPVRVSFERHEDIWLPLFRPETP
nr:OB-fold domain-containing protein [Novosphingobium panipatense]